MHKEAEGIKKSAQEKKGRKDMSNAIEVKNLVKRYKEVLALDHFSMEVAEGEIFGLLGPNGSGKTTTINCILSLLSFDKGEIKVFGKELRPDSYELKKEIGVVMQNVAVFEELTVYENIDYFCGLYIKDKETKNTYKGIVIYLLIFSFVIILISMTN